MCKGKFKRSLVSVVALGMSIVMFSGCGLDSVFEHEPADPAFNPNGVNNNNADVGVPKNNVQEPAKSEAPVEATTKGGGYTPSVPSAKKLEEKLNKGGYSMDPNKRLGKDSNGNYVEKKCVNPYCGCVDCKCDPCECDDR